MFNKRKAQGLSITTIIVAVIGLIVLVVIVAILTGKLGGFSEGLSKVGGCNDLCKSLGYGGAGFVKHPELRDTEGNVCQCMTGGSDCETNFGGKCETSTCPLGWDNTGAGDASCKEDEDDIINWVCCVKKEE